MLIDITNTTMANFYEPRYIESELYMYSTSVKGKTGFPASIKSVSWLNFDRSVNFAYLNTTDI